MQAQPRITGRVPFSLLLPVLSLALWVCLIAVPTTLIYMNFLKQAGGSPSTHLSFASFTADVQRSDFLPFAASAAGLRHTSLLIGLNLPGSLSNLFIPRAHRNPASMHPEAWEAIVYPLYCLPVWAFLGIALDALLNRNKIRWPILLVGTICFALLSACLVGFAVSMSATERADLLVPLWSFVLWVLLLTAFPAQWIAQWRRSPLTTANPGYRLR